MFKRSVALLACAALLGGCAGSYSSAGSAAGAGSTLPLVIRPSKTASPIQHVIVVIQENRTTDNLFNGFPGADTVSSGLNHNNKSVTLQPEGLEWQYDPSLTHKMLATEYNGGAMNGFDLDKCDADPLALSGGCKPPKNFAYSFVPPPISAGGASETEWYWLLAGQLAAVKIGYGFGDKMFSSRQVPSFPGHQFLIAGQTPAADDPWGPGAMGLPGIWGC